MTGALARPPPLPWQRSEWLEAAFRAIDALGPPSDGGGLLTLDAAPCVVLTVEGGGLARSLVAYEPFRVLRQPPRPRGPGAPFVVLTARGGGLSRTEVLFEPFRLVHQLRRQCAGARRRPPRGPLTCAAPSLRRSGPKPRPRRWARSTVPAAEARAVGVHHPLPSGDVADEVPRGQLLTSPTPAPQPLPELPPQSEPTAAPADWPWPPCPLAPVDARPRELVRAAIAEHRLWDVTEGKPGPRPPPSRQELPPRGSTAWPERRTGGRTFSEFWGDVRARESGERRALEEATATAREAGFLLRRTLGPSGCVYEATLEDQGLRKHLGGGTVVVTAASVEELRAALRPYWRALLLLGRPARLPRRKYPKKAPPPQQLSLELSLGRRREGGRQ